MSDDTPRWTEIEHLPEWDEEFYHIYTAKKFGKWVMMKTLRPEYADDPERRAMLEKEFDVRYNLAHPNIVMINDYEDVPGVGRAIITDDVYGDSLRKLIDNGKVTQANIDQLTHQLPAAMAYINSSHISHPALRPENIIFTENIGNLKLIDVGFEQRPALNPSYISDDIYNYGLVLTEALDAAGNNDPVLRRVAKRCTEADPAKRYRDIPQLQMALAGRSQKRLFIVVTITIILLLMMVIWLLSPYRPAFPVGHAPL